MKDKNKSTNKDKSKKEKSELRLTELFMAKAGWNRCFIGSLTRNKDPEGKELLCCTVDIKKSTIICQADDRVELGKQLDVMCILVLDYDLHETKEVSAPIIETPFICN